ncbi:hypothetical protein DFH06DRAFT_1130936 [Mycena polygramma]|nr:hypothetical protein DFH06DRAFT_1130936 [Mycena polygramma]
MPNTDDQWSGKANHCEPKCSKMTSAKTTGSYSRTTSGTLVNHWSTTAQPPGIADGLQVDQSSQPALDYLMRNKVIFYAPKVFGCVSHAQRLFSFALEVFGKWKFKFNLKFRQSTAFREPAHLETGTVKVPPRAAPSRPEPPGAAPAEISAAPKLFWGRHFLSRCRPLEYMPPANTLLSIQSVRGIYPATGTVVMRPSSIPVRAIPSRMRVERKEQNRCQPSYNTYIAPEPPEYHPDM